MMSTTNFFSKRYLWLILTVLATALLGYSVFRQFRVFILGSPTSGSLWIVAIAAGTAALFSPCSFPLLLTLLVRTANDDGEGQSLLRRSVLPTLAISAGVVAFLLLMGVVMALGGQNLVKGVNFKSNAGRILRTTIGTGLLLLGLFQFSGRAWSPKWLDPFYKWLGRTRRQAKRQQSLWGYSLYGFGYVLGGFG